MVQRAGDTILSEPLRSAEERTTEASSVDRLERQTVVADRSSLAKYSVKKTRERWRATGHEGLLRGPARAPRARAQGVQ